MADDILIRDGAGVNKTIRATDKSSIHHPHHVVEGIISTAIPAAGVNADPVKAYFNEYGEQVILAGGLSALYSANLVLDTAVYAAGDVLGDLLTLAGVSRKAGGTVVLQSIGVIDKDDQGAAFDIILFDRTVTMAAKNAVWAVADGDMDFALPPPIRITASDYIDLGGNRIAGKSGLGIVMKPNASDLFVGTLSQGAGTYTASGIRLVFGFLRD